MKPLHLKPGERVRLIVTRPSDPERWEKVRCSQPSEEDRELAEAGLD